MAALVEWEGPVSRLLAYIPVPDSDEEFGDVPAVVVQDGRADRSRSRFDVVDVFGEGVERFVMSPSGPDGSGDGFDVRFDVSNGLHDIITNSEALDAHDQVHRERAAVHAENPNSRRRPSGSATRT